MNRLTIDSDKKKSTYGYNNKEMYEQSQMIGNQMDHIVSSEYEKSISSPLLIKSSSKIIQN